MYRCFLGIFDQRNSANQSDLSSLNLEAPTPWHYLFVSRH